MDSEINISINNWRHLFSDGEYPSRKELLSGLTLEQVTTVPGGMSHSVHGELWHLTKWQDAVISNDKDKFNSWEEGHRFPEENPKSIEEWEELVSEFQNGVERIFEYVKSGEDIDREVEQGFTMRDVLSSLAVHNAVHFGKILAIRQLLGAWSG